MKKITATGAVKFFLLGILISFGALITLSALGQKGGDHFSDNLYIAAGGSLLFFCIFGALVTSLLSLIKFREHNFWVFLGLALGLLGSFFILGEILFEH